MKDAVDGTEKAIVQPAARRSNAEFWERPDILGARNAMDVWASCKHHRFSGCGVSVPTLERIFDFPRAEVGWFGPRDVDERTGLGQILEFMARTTTDSVLAAPRLIELSIDWALLHMDASPFAMELMLELYPRVGPYEQKAYADPEAGEAVILRAYRPPELVVIAGRRRSRRLQETIDALLRQWHREILSEVAKLVRMPAIVFEAKIDRIAVPPKPKRQTRREVRQLENNLVQILGLESKEDMERLDSCDTRRKKRAHTSTEE